MGRGDIIMIQLKSVYSRVLTVQLFFEEVIDVSLLLVKQALLYLNRNKGA